LLQGATGPEGEIGPQGLRGLPGPIGLSGAPGQRGPIGNPGVAGQPGPMGHSGNPGPQGIRGEQGPEGAIGPQGPAGSNGAPGPAGQNGAVGPAGAPGRDGVAGAQGQPGQPGSPGPAGAPGSPGMPAAPAVPPMPAGTGVINGMVRSVLTGQPIAGATVSLSWNGVVRSTTLSSASGTFRFNALPAETFVITSQAPGQEALGQTISLSNGQTRDYSVALGPPLGPRQARIVLTWNAQPSDLDSHLETPGGCNVYARRQRLPPLHRFCSSRLSGFMVVATAPASRSPRTSRPAGDQKSCC
jgi:hypothetical protein